METTFENVIPEDGGCLSKEQRLDFYKKMFPIAVQIICFSYKQISNGKFETLPASTGSGFLISEYGNIMTCSHVVKKAYRIFFRSKVPEIGDVIKLTEVIRKHNFPRSDVAVLQLRHPTQEKYNFCKWGDTQDIYTGMEALSITNPHDLLFSFLFGHVSKCFLTIGRSAGPADSDYGGSTPVMLLKNLYIGSGGSGAPIFNSKGHVIGMTSFGGRDQHYSIHGQRLRAIFDHIAPNMKEEEKERLKKERNRKRKRTGKKRTGKKSKKWLRKVKLRLGSPF